MGSPRQLQRFWMKRMLRGESFALTAPTGSGKTKFGLVAAVFNALRGKRSYLVFPTTLLVEQAVADLQEFQRKHAALKEVAFNRDATITVAYYHGQLRKAEKEQFLSVVKNGKFDILLTTSQFLTKNFPLLKEHHFDWIFVDDIDALLKNSRNLGRILELMGFNQRNGTWEGKTQTSLVIASATAKKGSATKIFQELLGFDVGARSYVLRNIVDVIVGRKELHTLRELLCKMGPGGIIYVESSTAGEELYKELSRNFNIGLVSAKHKQDYERFMSGELDYLIGMAHYQGVLVRGVDQPTRIRYVVFWGLPTFKFNATLQEVTPHHVKMLLAGFKEETVVQEFLPFLSVLDKKPRLLEKAKTVLRELLAKNQQRISTIVIKEDQLIFPDVKTYLQASGRSSRLLPSGLTKGAAFIFEDDTNVLEAFVKKATYYDVAFKQYSAIDIAKLCDELDKSRTVAAKNIDLLKPVLFVVESPTKAKHIARFFGMPSLKKVGPLIVYEVASDQYLLLITASLGHVTDLAIGRGLHGVEMVNTSRFLPIYASIKRCQQCGYQTTVKMERCLQCGSLTIDDTFERIIALRKLAHDCEMVIVGTDPDAEGEKIAWDIMNLVTGLATIHRAEFHEVTPRAIRKALKELRSIDHRRVDAQIVRRIEDRWLGFELSQKVQAHFNQNNLSAGRVQTPVLGWIIEQEMLYRQKKTIPIIEPLKIEIPEEMSEKIKPSQSYVAHIKKVEEKDVLRLPPPPFTTDELLREASQRLKFSATKTMTLAQDLFESGLITYHRTDSHHVSEVGLQIAKEYLKDDFTARTWEEKGTHECIRPTRPIDRNTLLLLINEGVIQIANYTFDHVKLYDLIFRRFMASQCPTVKTKETRFEIQISSLNLKLTEQFVTAANGRAYDLYHFIYVKPELPEGTLNVSFKLTKVPRGYPYTEADVVKRMKDERIGRPSTYATILNKLFLRHYIIERKNLLFSTKRGREVYKFLEQHYQKYISVNRTRELLDRIDRIESGVVNAQSVLKDLYHEIKE